MFCPMIRAQAWSSPTAPAKCADSVTAMAAVDDCITAVMASPATIKIRTPSTLDHQLTPGPNTAGRSAGCNRSATPPMPCCNVVNPYSTSANPASAPPAADTRPRPSSLIRAPTKIIGSAAAVSETRTPMSAISQPVPVVPTFAPKTRPNPCWNVNKPALTRPIVVMVVALEDCTRSVTIAPQKEPSSGVAAALLSTVRRAEPASAFSPSVITVMPSRKRPTPPSIEIAVDMRAPKVNDDQASSRTVKAVRDYVDGGPWELIGEYTEVETGKRSDRPELEKAIAACKKHRARLVIAKLDRLSRNVAFIATLLEKKIDFLCCDNPHATKFNLHILAAVAEFERDAISKRTTEALAAAKARGVKLGNYQRIARAKQAP